MLKINKSISIPLSEIDVSAVRAQGPGGQNVNKVSTAVQIRLDINACSTLSDDQKARVLQSSDRRLSRSGIVVIKSQRFRSQEKNRADALQKLARFMRKALEVSKPRKPTRPTRASREKRLEDKARRGRLKQSRGRIIE